MSETSDPFEAAYAEDESYDAIDESDDMRFRFIGEKGAAALNVAEEATTRLDNLAVAREMEAANSDADTIKIATSWERGADGLWRYETNDVELTMDDIKQGTLKRLMRLFSHQTRNTKIYLRDIPSAKDIIKTYPSMQNMKIKVTNIDNPKHGGFYSPAKDEITIITPYSYIEENIDKFNRTLNHELQHAIQEREGFARGSNLDQFNLYRDFLNDVQDLHEVMMGDPIYRQIAKLIEKIDGYMQKGQKGELSSKDKANVEKKRKLVQDLFYSDEVKPIRDEIDRIIEKYGTGTDDVENIAQNPFSFGLRANPSLADFDAYRRVRLAMQSSLNRYARGEYMRTSGEVEARNVTKRMDMSADERNLYTAEETEDVARKDQLFFMEAAKSFSSPSRANSPSFGFSMSSEEFDAVQREAVEKRGIVSPDLASKSVEVIEVPKHDFKGENPIKQTKEWAKGNLVGSYIAHKGEQNEYEYKISKSAIDKYLSKSAIERSENLGVHIAILTKLPTVIDNSIDAEIHPDYSKGRDSKRSAENKVGNKDMLVHRLYGAVNIDGKMYRVKATMNEYKSEKTKNAPHSFEVIKIELLDAPSAKPAQTEHVAMTPNNSISATNLLKGVEKSYDKGKKLLDESENSSQSGQDDGNFTDKAAQNDGDFSSQAVENGANAVENQGEAVDPSTNAVEAAEKAPNCMTEVQYILAYFKTKLALWFDFVDKNDPNGYFKSVKDTFASKHEKILNYFIDGFSNAKAESLNAKIKEFRRRLKGVKNKTFFLFRLANLLA